MGTKHRKLFPAIATSNQTQDCSGFCDAACPYNCYSFPDYYFPPPPPPISPTDHSSPGNHVSSYFIIFASLFTFIFVLVGFYVIKVKCYAHWRGRRAVNAIGPSPSQSDNSEEEFFDENQVVHPIWLITTTGLQQSIINSITVCTYRKGEGLIEGTECSVCLNEFQEDETLRLLPKCNHAFHIPCIDTWLRSHTNCPLCRAGIVSNNVSPEAAMSNLASTEQNDTNLRRDQETQMENTRSDGELSNNTLATASGASENWAGTGVAGEALEFTDESKSNSKERGNPTGNQQVLNDEIQRDMRFFSIHSRLDGNSCPSPGLANYCSAEPGRHPVDHIQDDTEPHAVNHLKQDDDHSTMFQERRHSSIAECLHISPVSMKRSFSCSGRILSKKGYGSPNSTLP